MHTRHATVNEQAPNKVSESELVNLNSIPIIKEGNDKFKMQIKREEKSKKVVRKQRQYDTDT